MADTAGASCTQQLRAIGRALAAYRSRHGEWPWRLSEISPRDLADPAMFHCPADPSPGDPLFAELVDPRLPTSYVYWLNENPVPSYLGWELGPRWSEGLTWRELRLSQRLYYGDRVPVMSCRHHQPLFIHFDLSEQIYPTNGYWERDPTSVAQVLGRLQEALTQDPTQFAANWLRPEVEDYFRSCLSRPAPDALQCHLGQVAEQLCAIPRLPEGAFGPALYCLAARLYRGAERTEDAIRAYQDAIRCTDDRKHSALFAKSLSRREGTKGKAVLAEAYLQVERARHGIPGLSVSVLREGEPLVALGYGLADVELSAPATPETVYPIASMTKPFTAVAIMMFEEERKLGLDDRVAEILPGLPIPWGDITVRHLLTHTSGIKDLFNAPGWPGTTEHTPESYLAVVADLPLEFQPGERLSYSNTGYILLGKIIEEVSGTSYGHFLTERIFLPLEMTSTSVMAPGRSIENRASGYGWEGETLEKKPPIDPQGANAAMGGLTSTIRDLAKWDAALYGETILKRSTLERMWSPTRLHSGCTVSYGLGWQLGEDWNRKRAGHNGRNQGFSTCLYRFIDERLTIIVLCNLNQTPAAETMAKELALLNLP